MDINGVLNKIGTVNPLVRASPEAQVRVFSQPSFVILATPSLSVPEIFSKSLLEQQFRKEDARKRLARMNFLLTGFILTFYMPLPSGQRFLA
jgi:hypothetical protein